MSKDKRQRGARRQQAAILRRATTPAVVRSTPAGRVLIAILRAPLVRRAKTALVLAQVKEDTLATLAAQVGCAGGGAPRLSEARFRRLLVSKERERAALLARLVRHADGRANVENLAEAVLAWSPPVRMQWTTDYYGTAQADPAPPTPPSKE